MTVDGWGGMMEDLCAAADEVEILIRESATPRAGWSTKNVWIWMEAASGSPPEAVFVLLNRFSLFESDRAPSGTHFRPQRLKPISAPRTFRGRKGLAVPTSHSTAY